MRTSPNPGGIPHRSVRGGAFLPQVNKYLAGQRRHRNLGRNRVIDAECFQALPSDPGALSKYFSQYLFVGLPQISHVTLLLPTGLTFPIRTFCHACDLL